jgi:lysophospholipase L1-like esterase
MALGLVLSWSFMADAVHGQAYSNLDADADVGRWSAQDELHPPEPGSVLFVGSSSIRRWEQLALDFHDYKIIQRGFGGSTFEQLNDHVQEVVLSHNPAAIVVWSGANDIDQDTDPNPETVGQRVCQRFVNFVSKVRSDPDNPSNAPIFYLGMFASPGRVGRQSQVSAANRLISSYIESNAGQNLRYVDLPARFDGLGFSEHASMFVDPIHLNRRGYDCWSGVIRTEIEELIPPNKQIPTSYSFQPGRRILFDFGPTAEGQTTGLDGDVHWNNWHAGVQVLPNNVFPRINAGEHVDDLKDARGLPTGIDLTITGGFSAAAIGGLTDPGPNLGSLAVPTATKDYFFSDADNFYDASASGDVAANGNDDVSGGFMLDGLNPSLVYDIRFVGSRKTNPPETPLSRTTEYRVTGENVTMIALQTSGGPSGGNTDQFTTATGVRPDKFGQIFVDLTAELESKAYLNAMEITARFPANFLAEWKSSFASIPGGDANGDGWSDGADFLIWQRQLGSPSSILASASIPEPQGARLLMSCVVFLLARRAYCWKR